MTTRKKETKPKRTQVKDLKVEEQELTGQAMKQVQGGASNLNSSKSNLIQPETGYVTKTLDKASPKLR
jgi:hypothetical protein